MSSHPLLDTEITNLTCQSPMDAVRSHLANKSECRLTDGEMQAEFLLTFYVPILICCSGIGLNLVNFCVLRRQQFEGPAYAYMAAISMLDALFLMFYILYVASALRCGDHSDKFPCTAVAFLRVQFDLTLGSVYLTSTVNFALQTSCAWLSVILGVERYLAMRYFHFRRTRCQNADTRLVVALVCLASLLLNLPNSFALRTSTVHLADGDNVSRVRTIEHTQFGGSSLYSAYSLVKLVATSLLPFALLAVNNTLLLAQVIGRHRRQKRSAATAATARTSKVLQASLSRIQAQRNLTILLIVVIFVFLCGQVPRSLLFREVFALLHAGCPCGTTLLWMCCPLYRRLHPLCELVYLLSLNVNFFIYAGLNEHFRAQLRLPGLCGRGPADEPQHQLQQLQQQLDDDQDVDLFSAAGGTTIGCSQQQPELELELCHDGNNGNHGSEPEECKRLMVSQL